MRLPLWIGGPIVIALAAADAVVELQCRAIGTLTRATIMAMDHDVAVGAALMPTGAAAAELRSTAAGK